jgi:hypothetical protein
LVLFVRIGTYQWVTVIPNKNFSPARVLSAQARLSYGPIGLVLFDIDMNLVSLSSFLFEQAKGWRHFSVAYMRIRAFSADLAAARRKGERSETSRSSGFESGGKAGRHAGLRQGKSPALSRPIRSRSGFGPLKRTGASPSYLPALPASLPSSSLQCFAAQGAAVVSRRRAPARFRWRQITLPRFPILCKQKSS